MDKLANLIAAKLPQEIEDCGRGDARQLGSITADAFQNDPFNAWLFRNPQAMEATFSLLARDVYAPRGMCHRIGDHAATLWLASDQSGEPSLKSLLPIYWAITRGFDFAAYKRIDIATKAMVRHKPKEPHLYLFLIGSRLDARGKGYGGKLMAPVISACDDAGIPVYLENSNPANQGFYGSFGFERISLFSPTPGAPPLEGMWRAPTG